MGERLDILSPFNLRNQWFYVSRAELTKQVNDILDSRDCLLVGGLRFGKTAFLKNFHRSQPSDHRSQPSDLLITFGQTDYLRLKKAVKDEEALAEFCKMLVDKLHESVRERETLADLEGSLNSYRSRLEWSLGKIEPVTTQQFEDIGRRLWELGNNSNVIMKMDDFDELMTAPELSTRFLTSLVDCLLALKSASRRRVRLLLTSSVVPNETCFLFPQALLGRKQFQQYLERGQIQRLSKNFQVIQLPLFGESDIREMARQGWGDLKVQITDWPEDRIDRLLDVMLGCAGDVYRLSGGHPLLARILYHHVLSLLDESEMSVPWLEVKQAAKTDKQLVDFLDELKDRFTAKQVEVTRLAARILCRRGELPLRLKRTLRLEELPPSHLPPRIPVGRKKVDTNEELKAVAHYGLLVRETTQDQWRHGREGVFMVGGSAYHMGAYLLWDVIAEKWGPQSRSFGVGQWLRSQVVDRYPGWPLEQVIYFLVLVYFALWLISDLFGISSLVKWTTLVPLLMYLGWMGLYHLFSEYRRK